VAAGSLLVPDAALAELALFRVEQRWHNSPKPAVTTPGGAGVDQGYIQPYTTKTTMGEYIYPPGVAIVEPGNPVGGAFTLPAEFVNITGTHTRTPLTGWPGYTTIVYTSYYNGPGKFGPNHGATGPTRIVFPTTMGNPYPTYNGTLMKWAGGDYGYGAPVIPTTTFSGRCDLSRGGSITVTPGPNRFGGTMRLFYGPNAGFFQYIYYFSNVLYKVYGNYTCLDEGKFGCTPNTFVSTAGDITQIYAAYRYVLNERGTGTGKQTGSNTAKATTPTTEDGRWPTQYGNASYVVVVFRYLNNIHPWTTGYAKVHNPKGSPTVITPQAQGYDTSLGGADITVTHYDWNANWNPTLSTVTTTTVTTRQYLHGVGRIVSMVRPRLIHTYVVPLDPSEDPIYNMWNVARLWRLKVFFLPEPAGMLLLGVGLGCLVVLHGLRRRS
jgi:hypothetical protein